MLNAQTNPLHQLVEAIKNDDYQTAQNNELWEPRSLDTVLGNDQTILQMCADVGAVRCFWHALLAGASLENPHFDDHPHPLILALKNHHNLFAQMIMVLRNSFDPQEPNRMESAQKLNLKIKQEGLNSRMLPLVKQLKENSALIESLIFGVLIAKVESHHPPLLKRIIKFATSIGIKNIAFENFAFLAITLKKDSLFKIFLDNNFIQRKSFKFVEESFLYHAIKCKNDALIENLMAQGHDYKNLYPNLIRHPNEFAQLKRHILIFNAAPIKQKNETEVDAKKFTPVSALFQLPAILQAAPVNTALTQDVYGTGEYNDAAQELPHFWNSENKNFLAFYRRLNVITPEEANSLFLTSMENYSIYPGISYCLALMKDADIQDVPQDKLDNFVYLAHRSGFGLSPLDFLVNNMEFYNDLKSLATYVEHFQLDLNIIALRCVSLSKFKSLKILLDAIEAEQQKQMIQIIFQIDMLMVKKIVVDLLEQWHFIHKHVISAMDFNTKQLPRILLEMIYDYLDEKEVKSKFRILSHQCRDIAYVQDGNGQQLYQLYNTELNKLRELVDTLAKIKQSKFYYLPKTLMTVDNATDNFEADLFSKIAGCFMIVCCLPNWLRRSPSFKNLTRIFLPIIVMAATITLIASVVVPLWIEDESYDNSTNYPNGMSAAQVFEWVVPAAFSGYFFIVSLGILIGSLYGLLSRDHQHNIPANRISKINRLAEELNINLDGQTVEMVHQTQSRRLESFHTDPSNLTSLPVKHESNVSENRYGWFYVDNTPLIEQAIVSPHDEENELALVVAPPAANMNLNNDEIDEEDPEARYQSQDATERTSLIGGKQRSCSIL